MDSAFSRLISEASAEAKSEFKDMAFSKSEKNDAKCLEVVSDEDNDADSNDIINIVSEYIFDLFDANCTIEYRRLKTFEDNACKHFLEDVEEYSFEQQKLHDEYCSLFEDMCSDFLHSKGYSTEQFYDEVRVKMAEEGEHEDSNDIVGVIHQVADFTVWAKEMRQLAKTNAKNPELAESKNFPSYAPYSLKD